MVDGITYFFAADPVTLEPAPTAHLLQPYDEYAVAFSESKYLLDASGRARQASGDAPVFNGVLLMDGQLTGAWRRASSEIEVALYRPLSPAEERALQAAAERYGTFLGLSVRLSASLLRPPAEGAVFSPIGTEREVGAPARTSPPPRKRGTCSLRRRRR